MKHLFEKILRRKKKTVFAPGKRRQKWNLNDTLVTLDAVDERIDITIGQVCEGVMVFGTSGSGKTSGPLNTIQEAMFREGFGILNICVKTDEAERAIALAKLTGREKDVRVMRFGSDVACNFLNLLRPMGAEAVNAGFKQINQSLLGKMKEDEWTNAASEHFTNLISLFILAGRSLEIADLLTALNDKNIHRELIKAAESIIPNSDKADMETLKLLAKYFMDEWPKRGDRTMASVLMSITPTLVPFCMNKYMRALFCKESTFNPDELRHGCILVIDISCIGPMKTYGRSASTILKYMVQKMVESNLGNGKSKSTDSTRPVVIVADEAQTILTGDDSDFVATSRAYRGSLFYLTQDINQFHKRGGETIKAETESLLSNLHGVRVMCQNEDSQTFEWFNKIIGKVMREQFGESGSFSGPTGGGSVTTTRSLVEKDQVSRRDMGWGLSRGGPPNKFVVTGFLQQSGRLYKGAKQFKQVAFKQRAMPTEEEKIQETANAIAEATCLPDIEKHRITQFAVAREAKATPFAWQGESGLALYPESGDYLMFVFYKSKVVAAKNDKNERSGLIEDVTYKYPAFWQWAEANKLLTPTMQKPVVPKKKGWFS